MRGREYMRLYRLMVPEQEEKKLYRDAHNNLAEYAELYERHLLIKRGVMCEGVELLSRQEQKKLQLFEDALAIGRLARRRVLVQQKVDAAIHEAKRQREQAAGAAQGSRGLLGRLAEWATSRSGRGAAEGGSPRPLATPLAVMGQSPTVSGPLGFTADDQERLERDFGDESKFEKVDMPTCFNFEFLLGKLAVDMIDDRWSRQDQRQVLSLALEEARVVVSLDFATDHHGRDASQWCLEVNLGAFHAFQAQPRPEPPRPLKRSQRSERPLRCSFQAPEKQSRPRTKIGIGARSLRHIRASSNSCMWSDSRSCCWTGRRGDHKLSPLCLQSLPRPSRSR